MTEKRNKGLSWQIASQFIPQQKGCFSNRKDKQNFNTIMLSFLDTY